MQAASLRPQSLEAGELDKTNGERKKKKKNSVKKYILS